MMKDMPARTTQRLRLYSIGLLAGLAIGFTASVFSGQGSRTLTGRLGGDFPAFYGAGRIVVEGDGAQLYDRGRQQAAQRDILPPDVGFLLYAYPPYVALACAPLGLLPYRAAYLVYTATMLGALVLVLQFLRRISPTADEHFIPAVALTLAFYPLLMATFNGQNTPMTLLFIVLAWRAATGGRPWLAGVWLGLLLYKPQFAVPLIGLYLLSGRWKVVASSAAVAAVLFGVSTGVSGADWFSAWMEFAGWFANVDAANNRHNAISWLGFLQAVFGVESRGAQVVGWALTGLTVLGLSWLWVCGGRRRGDETAQMAVTVPSLTLMSPHAMYYDVGVCLFTFVVLLERLPRWHPGFIAAVLLLGASQVVAGYLGASPVFLLAVGTFALAVTILWASARDSTTSGADRTVDPSALESGATG